MKFIILFILIINLILKNDYVNGSSLKEKQCNYIKKVMTLNQMDIEFESDCCGFLTLCDQGDKGEIELLDFSRMSKGLPEGIGIFSNIKTLYIFNSGINKLPDDISKLKNLENLSIRNSMISEIPTGIGELKNLKKIYFHNTPIKTIPKELYDLPNLEELVIQGTNIKSITEGISKLGYLNILSIGDNKYLNKLPNDIYDLRLKEFYVHGDPQLELKLKFKHNIKICRLESDVNISCHQSNCENLEFDSSIPLCSDYRDNEKEEEEVEKEKLEFEKEKIEKDIHSLTETLIQQTTTISNSLLESIPSSIISSQPTLENDKDKTKSLEIQENQTKSPKVVDKNNNNVHNNEQLTVKSTNNSNNNSNNSNNDNKNYNNQENKNNSRITILLTIALSLAIVIIISDIGFCYLYYNNSFKEGTRIMNNKVYTELSKRKAGVNINNDYNSISKNNNIDNSKNNNLYYRPKNQYINSNDNDKVYNHTNNDSDNVLLPSIESAISSVKNPTELSRVIQLIHSPSNGKTIYNKNNNKNNNNINIGNNVILPSLENAFTS